MEGGRRRYSLQCFAPKKLKTCSCHHQNQARCDGIPLHFKILTVGRILILAENFSHVLLKNHGIEKVNDV